MALTLLTSVQAAKRLGISRGRVTKLAKARKVGRKMGRDWVFTVQDLEALAHRPPGRPRLATRRPKRRGGKK